MVKEMVKYAVLDWDNTLRKGFTITAWMEYLYAKRMVSDEHYSDFLSQFESYNRHMLDYCQLSDNTTEIYAKAIAGKNVLDIENAGWDFCTRDCAVFPFVSQLFHSFRVSEIKIIVISGTPQMLLKHYSGLLGIDEVYGLVIGVKEGYYTGVVEKDYGGNKTEIIKEICAAKGGTPIFALGDSIADEPLINAAKYGCYIDKNTGTIFCGGKTIGSISAACEAIEKLDLFL